MTECERCGLLNVDTVCLICREEVAGRSVYLSDTTEFLKCATLLFRCMSTDDNKERNSILREGIPTMRTPKPACPQGHPYTPENIYYRGDNGARVCRTCVSIKNSARKKAA